MNEIYDLHVTVNGRPAYATMVKYRIQKELKIGARKIIEGIKPRIQSVDEWFETRGGTR